MSGEDKTREKIIKSAESEFLKKGFRDASLRKIASDAGVTTGSLYWHFKNKEELFDAIVSDDYECIMNIYQEGTDQFFALSKEDQLRNMGSIGNECMARLLEYVYQRKPSFQLLTGGAAGTKYENMIHDLTEAEVESTHRVADHMRQLGIESPRIAPELEHVLISGMFASFLELVTHDVPLDTARECARQIHAFHTAGWKYLMNIPE